MFSNHPRELEIRRKRCSSMISRLGVAARAPHTCCNICGCGQTVVLANRDRYDFPVRTALCPGCGLIYLVDRLTPKAYSDFYGDGTYRALTVRFNGHEAGLEAIQRDQVDYAAHVINALESCFDVRKHRSLLDVGSSAGVVAATVASRFRCAATVLDPAAEQITAAKALGLEGVVGSLETYQTDKKFDLILLCRSIEHLFDLRCSLLRIRNLLQADGLLYCDIIDFMESCRRDGAPEAITKIDHCYWLCQETAPVIFEALGFKIISADVSFRSDTIGYLMRPCEAMGVPRAAEAVLNAMVRRLREINSDWCSYGQLPRSVPDRFRRVAYRAKRRVIRALSQNGIRAFDCPLEVIAKQRSPDVVSCPSTVRCEACPHLSDRPA